MSTTLRDQVVAAQRQREIAKRMVNVRLDQLQVAQARIKELEAELEQLKKGQKR